MNIPFSMEERKRLTQPERRARTRRALLDAAAAAFAQRGYHGASVEEIAAAAGVTKGALYYNFAGKEDLFLALLEEHVAARLQLVESLRGAAPEALRDGARRVAASLRRDREWSLLFFEFAAQAARDPRVRRRFEARMRPVRRALAGLVEDLAPPGADAARLAETVDALVDGVAMRTLLRPGDDPGELLAGAVEWLWRGAR